MVAEGSSGVPPRGVDEAAQPFASHGRAAQLPGEKIGSTAYGVFQTLRKNSSLKTVPGEHDAGIDEGALYHEMFGESSYAFDQGEPRSTG